MTNASSSLAALQKQLQALIRYNREQRQKREQQLKLLQKAR